MNRSSSSRLRSRAASPRWAPPRPSARRKWMRRRHFSETRRDQAMTDETTAAPGPPAAASAPSSARPMPASRRWSTSSPAPRCRSSATRCRRRGRASAPSPSKGNAQIVLVDTPGIFKPKRMLDRAMVQNAWGGAGDADAVVLLVDGRPGLTDEAKAIIDAAGGRRRPRPSSSSTRST